MERCTPVSNPALECQSLCRMRAPQTTLNSNRMLALQAALAGSANLEQRSTSQRGTHLCNVLPVRGMLFPVEHFAGRWLSSLQNIDFADMEAYRSG
jgi:hypothetical protein